MSLRPARSGSIFRRAATQGKPSGEPCPSKCKSVISFLTSLNSRSSGGRARLCDVFVFLRRIAADADSADDFALVDNWYPALKRSRTRQRKGRHASVADLIFEYLAWPAKYRGGARLTDANFDACNLRIVEAVQYEQIS